MKISIAQLNYHIGNFEKNKGLIIKAIDKARSEGSDLVVFSELCVPGYPPLDLLDRIDFIEKCNRTVNEITDHCKGIAAVIGTPVYNKEPGGRKLYNSALVLSDGMTIFSANKSLLPTYDVFDEYRYFEPGKEFRLLSLKGINIALTICEDLWDDQPHGNWPGSAGIYPVAPMEELAVFNPDLVINISASPFSYQAVETRRNIFVAKALKHRIPVISVNQTGANTGLIFDGASLAVNRNGQIFRQLGYFEEAVETFSLEDLDAGFNFPDIGRAETAALIHKALITGIQDYFAKTGFRKAILGLSGGLDSAVCLCLAAEALGPDNVLALLMPSRYSPGSSVNDSVVLAEKLGIKYQLISIEEPMRAFEKTLKGPFKGLKPDVTEENIQARIRAILLMAYSNKFGYMLLNTSNKSETAVGYSTLYGDMAGGLSVIGDVYKSDVYKLASYINRNGETIPEPIIRKPPSAELKPGQLDTDSLPPYDILDPILYRYIELQKPPDEIVAEGWDRGIVEKVIRMINVSEYKRFQAPPVLRISSKSFGDGWKMPLAARY